MATEAYTDSSGVMHPSDAAVAARDARYAANAPPATVASNGNSIGAGLTPTSGAASVALSGLSGGNSNYQQWLNAQTETHGSFDPNNYSTDANGTRYTPGYAPAVTTPAVNSVSSVPTSPTTKPNAYYTQGDAASAQALSPYYNLVPYTNQTLGAGDVAVGGSAVIPDSALSSATTRIAGYDATGTASQVSNYIKSIPPITTTSTPQQITSSIQGASQAVTTTMGQIQALVNQTANSSQNVSSNVVNTLNAYMGQMETFFNSYVQQAQSAYDNGMKDPGLVQAIALIADQATTMKKQLDETLNARNMGQSGVYIQAMNDVDKTTQQTEQTAISTHLSELTKNLQDAMTTVLGQRVAALTQFAGVASQAEIADATNHITALQAAISGLGQLAQTQQAGVNNLNDNATSAANNAANNATSIANNTATINQSNLESIRNDATKRAELVATINQNDVANKLDSAKLDEMIRSNKAGEAIALISANAQARSASASYLAAQNSGASKPLTADQIMSARETAVGHVQVVTNGLQAQLKLLDDKKLTGSEVVANGEDYYRKMFSIPAANDHTMPDRDTDAENLQLKVFMDAAKTKAASEQAANVTSSDPWWKGLIDSSNYVVPDNYYP